MRYGFPETLITDLGLEFNSKELRDKFEKLGINHKRSTPAHPQTNGAIERFHRTLKSTLRKLCNNNTSAWEDHLADALWAYRISESEARGNSPYFLLFGLHPDAKPLESHEDTRFESLARAQRHAFVTQTMAKQKRQERSKLDDLCKRTVAVGDYITINQAEPISLSHLRDHAMQVVSVRGKVISYVPVARDAPIKTINIDRVRIVPPSTDWSTINPRQRRNRGPVDVRTLRGPLNTQDISPEAATPDRAETEQPVSHSHGETSRDTPRPETPHMEPQPQQEKNAPLDSTPQVPRMIPHRYHTRSASVSLKRIREVESEDTLASQRQRHHNHRGSPSSKRDGVASLCDRSSHAPYGECESAKLHQSAVRCHHGAGRHSAYLHAQLRCGHSEIAPPEHQDTRRTRVTGENRSTINKDGDPLGGTRLSEIVPDTSH